MRGWEMADREPLSGQIRHRVRLGETCKAWSSAREKIGILINKKIF